MICNVEKGGKAIREVTGFLFALIAFFGDWHTWLRITFSMIAVYGLLTGWSCFCPLKFLFTGGRRRSGAQEEV